MADDPGKGELQDLIVPGSAGRRIGEFGLGIFWALFSLMNFFPPSHQAFAPWFFGPLGGLIGLHFLGRAFDARPRLIVSSEGITDRTALLGGALFVPWSDVLDVSAGRWGGGVSLLVRDIAAVRRRAGVIRRMWMRLQGALGVKSVPISIGVVGLKDRLDAGLLEFERRELGLSPPAPRLENSDREDDELA